METGHTKMLFLLKILAVPPFYYTFPQLFIIIVRLQAAMKRSVAFNQPSFTEY